MHAAAKARGVRGTVDAASQELQSLDIAAQRSSEYHSLQGASERRAVTEQAIASLMARHVTDSDKAVDWQRHRCQHTGREVAHSQR